MVDDLTKMKTKKEVAEIKVISFKVDDDVYNALKKKYKNQTFRSIFEPLAIELAQNNGRATKYTGSIRKNSSDLYIDLCLIQKTMQKIMKYFENGKHQGD